MEPTDPTAELPSPPAGQPSDPGWHADPFGRHERRWWSGDRWSEKVADGKHRSLDPPGIELSPASHELEVDEPAAPITDAALPIRPPAPWAQLSFMIGMAVMVALVVLIALVALGIV